MDEGLSSLKYNAMANLNTNQRLAKVAKSNEDKTETDEINPASLENDLLALGFAQKGIVNQADALSEKLLEISMIGEDLSDDIVVLKSDEKTLVPVKEGRFKRQMFDLMRDNTAFIKDYIDEKSLNENQAAEVIKKYNHWRASQ
jgi:hypothetical protein